MNKWLELIIGLVLVIAPLFVAITNWHSWGNATIVFIKGALVVFLIIVGLILLLLGISDLKD